MSTLVVDIGNSRIKWARVGGGRLLDPGEASHLESPASAMRSMTEAQPRDIRRLVATNVAGETLRETLTETARDAWGIAADFVMPVREAHGVRCGYTDPSRLGADRWVALIVSHRTAGGPAGVIDAGTTVTLDVVDADGGHLGGLIMAGPRIVRGALQRETSGIGETSGTPRPSSDLEVLGKSTDEAVAKGALLSVASGLDRALAAVATSLGAYPTVYITGGDAPVLAPWLETETHYRANLVLEGLALIAAES